MKPGGRERKKRLIDPDCDLCADNWFFVLGAGGRTGTTTALAMFDSIPGVELSGEHFGVLHEEQRMYDKVMAVSQTRGAAWKHHNLDERYMKCSIQERMKRVVLGNRYDELIGSAKVIGFKEIR